MINLEKNHNSFSTSKNISTDLKKLKPEELYWNMDNMEIYLGTEYSFLWQLNKHIGYKRPLHYTEKYKDILKTSAKIIICVQDIIHKVHIFWNIKWE